MRTTITLDPDTEALLKRLMRQRGISFKEAVNHAIRVGLAPGEERAPEFRTPTSRMGLNPAVNLDKALDLAAALEDDELRRRLAVRK